MPPEPHEGGHSPQILNIISPTRSLSVPWPAGPTGLSAPGLSSPPHPAKFPPVSGNKVLAAVSCCTFPLSLRLGGSGQEERKLLWKEELWPPSRETRSTECHRGRQRNYPYHSPWPEAMTRGNRLLQRGWHPVRDKALPHKILVKQCFIYIVPQTCKQKLPNSQTTEAT